MRKKNQYLFFLSIVLALMVNGCKKDKPLPDNPYDSVDYGENKKPVDTLNPASFVNIHKKILATKCAMPGCHDGHFEPDLRSVQSSYYTMVYQPVTKQLQPWKFRVTPGDTALSWLWQRINHEMIVSGTDTSQGRMPLYSSKLTAAELKNISDWILNGAKDMFGETPAFPDYEPEVQGYLAFNQTFNYRYDTIRINGVYYNPFIVDQNIVINLLVGVTDDFTPISQLVNTRMRFSKHPDNFSTAQTVQGAFFSFGGTEAWRITFNTNLFQPGDTIYMRFYTNDGARPYDTETPTDNLILPYKTYWSFYIKP
jgi:hypothetical protein